MNTTTSKFTKLKRFLTIAVALAIGVAIVATFISKKQPPARIEYVEVARSVRVIEATELPLMIAATGFGTAAPAQSWTAVSNVKGRIVYSYDDLESGALITKGTLLVEIDRGSYQLALAEVRAEIAGIDAEIAQINQEATNTATLLGLEQQRLDLAEADLQRTETLVANNAVAQTQLDVQLRTTLQQRQAVQALVNQQSILPIQLDRLNAQKERAISRRAQLERDLADTRIIAPFDIRIGDVNAALFQFVTIGQKLFSGDGIEAAEVTLQLPMAPLRRLLAEVPVAGADLKIGALSAEINLVGEAQTWDAEVVRIANGIDPTTRTVPVTLRVIQPESLANPMENPPLPKGAYVEGTLRIMTGTPKIILPQSALHEGWVYLVDADNRLIRRAVETDFQQDGMMVIGSGVQNGDLVIIDDISPAISGTLLNPQHDLTTQTTLADTASGAAN